MILKRSINVAIICLITISLAISIFPQKVYAEEVTLESASAKLDSVNAEYQNIVARAKDLAERLQETTTKAFACQNEMVKSNEQIGQLMKYEYINDVTCNLATMILTSENFQDLIKNMDYANSVAAFHSRIITEQAAQKAEFESMINDMNRENDQLNIELKKAEAKVNEAKGVLSDAQSRFSSDEMAVLAEHADGIPISGDDPVPGPTPGPSPTPSPSPSPDPQPTPTPGPDPEPTSWSRGVASAYGGSSDPYTPNPGRTATGDICDDYSTGVAIPMSWPNYRSYFHHTVQIRYDGRTVLATINDCGYMGGGSRSLDLQPGVFKAFGYGTCRDWGLRTVEYQIF